MWPFDLPVREALRLSGKTAVAWAVFDADWYRASYPDVPGTIPNQSDEAMLAYYLDAGQHLGHSPNRYFDEAWHLRNYPKIEALIEAGSFTSAFDAYCRGGNKDRSPHWLFDEVHYRRLHPDLTNDALDAGGIANGYDHYLRHGSREGRVGHPLFDPSFYRLALPPAERQAAEHSGPFHHLLVNLERHGAECPTSLYFDRAWYARQYQEAIAGSVFRSALEHYLCNDTPTVFDPLADFSEAWYLGRDSGLRDVIEAGDFRNGYVHFLRHGARELRSPAQHIDLKWYALIPAVRSDLARGVATDAFTHWLAVGKPRGLHAAPPPDELISVNQAKSLFRRRARDMLPSYGRSPLRFEVTSEPVVSVVMIIQHDLATTLMTLASLRHNFAGVTDLILVDIGLTEQTKTIGRFVTGATISRFEGSIGFSAAANAGLACARANAVLFLRDGIELAPGAMEAALCRLGSDSNIGAVGGKIVRPHGVLRNAGGVMWRDGTTHEYLNNESPLMPEACFVRDVPFCTSAFLMVSRSLALELEGFDIDFVESNYRDADLCLRIGAAGYRVIYDPAVIVWECEEEPALSRSPATERTAAHFRERHAGFLARCHPPAGRALVFARCASQGQRRVLFIEDTVPLRTIGSGFVRSNDLIHVMAGLGYAVTVFPVNGSGFGLADIYADLPDIVEVMHDTALSRLAEFLLPRRGYYDIIWIARTHNLAKIRPVLEALLAGDDTPPRIVLDTEAISAAREAEQAAIAGQAFDLPSALRREFARADFCQKIVAVSHEEARLLGELGFPDIAVIGHMRRLRPTARPFAERAGLLFVGAIHQMDSPNYDSLGWLIDEVLPLVEQTLGWETRLTVAGYVDPDVAMDRFKAHPRVSLRGTVPDLEPLYTSHRVFVAPTRFAAGAPYKVHEAASFGLPVVATELLRRQLGWIAGQDILAAPATDAAAFAALIVALYRDKALWTRLRDSALVRLSREHNFKDYESTVEGVLNPVLREIQR